MIRLLFSYIRWHYGRAYAELFSNCRTFVSFLYHFFSIPELTHTLLSPWQMLGERYKKGFDISAFFQVLILNLLMRIVGFFVRLCVIVFGITIIIVVLIICVAAFIFWTLLPFVTLLLLVSGIRILFL